MTTPVEILAASYVITHYTTVATDQPHLFRLYFDDVPTADVLGAFYFPTYSDALHLTGWSVRDIIASCLTRMNAAHGGIQTLTVNEVEVWEADTADNTFLGLDAGDYTGVGAGSSSGIAAAYLMLVTKSALRNSSRFVVMDTVDSKPQSFRGITIPATDNASLEWFLTKSVVGFTNVKGERLAIAGSYNTGYNRKLARSYGRRKTP